MDMRKHRSYGDWTFAGSGDGQLDTATKYAGTSSYRSHLPDGGSAGVTNTLSRDSFTCTNLRVIGWFRRHQAADEWGYHTYIRHPSYGDLEVPDAGDEWQKWRVSFWYDSASNTKFGRREKWVGEAWVQQGDDTNFGTGSPAADTVVLKGVVVANGYEGWGWFDELEVYTA